MIISTGSMCNYRLLETRIKRIFCWQGQSWAFFLLILYSIECTSPLNLGIQFSLQNNDSCPAQTIISVQPRQRFPSQIFRHPPSIACIGAVGGIREFVISTPHQETKGKPNASRREGLKTKVGKQGRIKNIKK